jgi:hypothetical protein
MLDRIEVRVGNSIDTSTSGISIPASGSLGVLGFLCVRRDETFPQCRPGPFMAGGDSPRLLPPAAA